MRKATPAANPDAYVQALNGWQQACVKRLRAAVRRAKSLDEVVKWGHLVYFSNGPLALIRAEETRVLFGFWRGQRLTDIEPRLKPGGKYEMATIVIVEGEPLSAAKTAQLIAAAIALNTKLGDPTKAALKRKSRAAA
jgi:hypothetical protein